MKKLVITSIGVTSFANFLGLLGVVTGAIKAIVLPVLALVGAGSLGDVDSAIKGVSAAVTSDISSIVTFGVGGWVGGAVYAWIANCVLGWTKGVTIGAK
mgnify:FL=1|jgi:hypothetical protein|tara:strand:- start:227 stop:523 length:297 start_codon:yes stop_codon:yes gene_type:complete